MFVEIKLTGLSKNPDTQIKTGIQYLVQSLIVMINYSDCFVF